MSNLDLGLVGNSSYGALIDRNGRVVWACLPRFDSDPLFCSLLNGDGEPEIGFFDIAVTGLAGAEQAYVPNTAILRTTLYDHTGAGVEITDFAPRFHHHGRMFRPPTLVRRLRPVGGQPVIRVRLRPAYDHGAGRPRTTRGSNHLRFITPSLTLRMTTDVPITHLREENEFVLEEPAVMILGPDESLASPLHETERVFYDNTLDYWRESSRYLSVPFEWQDAVIRAAITLKMCAFEETGAIIAAITTSIPEAAGTGRNWDYRYCWLRDAYFVVHALNRLGATRTMEQFLRYLVNVVAVAEARCEDRLQPLYSIAIAPRLDERLIPSLAGYRGMGPVRVGNAAHDQRQHDVYGAVVLASAQMFFDQRLARPGTTHLFERLERMGEQAWRLYDKPDAGPWELRNSTGVHTFSALMCWCACDRLARIADRLSLTDRAASWAERADAIRGVIEARAWNDDIGAFTQVFDGERLDASMLLMEGLGFLHASDPRYVSTVEAVAKELKRGPYLFRYHVADDFGEPHNAFNICTFWYIEALAAIGRKDEARALFENMLKCRNHLGLLSEDLDPRSGELWGNFPQTYSMVGLINAAMRLSKSWEDAF